MKKRTKFLLLLLSVFSVTTFSRSASALSEDPDDILIVASLNLPMAEISITELKAIYLKKKLYWDSGQVAIPFNAKSGTRLRDAFQGRVLGMAPEAELMYWERQKIERALSPPREFSDTQKAVFILKNSVSYVFRKDFRSNCCKVLLVVPAR